MPDVLYHIYSGQVFFSALVATVLVVVVDLVGVTARSPFLQSAGRVVTLCGLALAVLSGTPVPLLLVVPGVVALLFWLFLPRERTGRRAWAAAALILVLILSMGWEARDYQSDRSPPLVPGSRSGRLGDVHSSRPGLGGPLRR